MTLALIFTMSRPFHFSLEKVLEYRKQIEDQARLAFSRAQVSEREQRRTLERLQEELEKCLEGMPRSGRTNPQELWLWAEWRRHLEVDTKAAEAELGRRERLLDSCRRELVARATERKLLEKLRHRQEHRHALKEQQREQNEFDESAMLRFGRASG
ncbi:flagellar export protein FliJ [Desulfomicrobium orale]|mgnify:CR=1 FL=1|nr:flagellar export protein FliJ [Desulfomicrobium orale]